MTKRLADVKVILNYKLLNNPKVVWKNELKAKQFVMWTKEFLVRALLIINETPEVALIKIEAKEPVWRQCSWFSVVLPITRPSSRYATWPQLRNWFQKHKSKLRHIKMFVYKIPTYFNEREGYRRLSLSRVSARSWMLLTESRFWWGRKTGVSGEKHSESAANT